MNPLADELNSVLDGTVAGRLLSGLGKRLFFPRGIIAQSAEAKKTARLNATLGMAYEKGKPIVLKAVADRLSGLKPEEAVVYAPTAGVPALRNLWKDSLVRKNPSLAGKGFSLPVTAPGITAGISYIADLFLDEGQAIIASDPCWDNYSLVFAERRAGTLTAVPFFAPGPRGADVFDISALKKAVAKEAKSGAVRLILNFPNNPSGYTPTAAEADAIVAMITETSKSADVLVISDDAYFGLFYEDGIYRESLFARFCALSDRVLAVKIDGPTKEDYVWGFRTAFITLGSKGLGQEHYDALEKKLMGAIRSSVSCANTPAQSITLKTLESPGTAKEKERLFRLLQERYRAVRRFVAENAAPETLEAMPFNSGYFMCFRCKGISADKLRLALLEKGIGVIALDDTFLRVTFAAVDESEINELYGTIYETAANL
jgi:aspartate/methionine/tyrosine aminotransferase